MSIQIIIDASNAVLGRIASYAAKQSLLGKEVIIVNCNKANIIYEYLVLREKGGSAQKGPYFPKHPDRILKRTIRGMLSHHQKRGLDAIRRIMCHNDTPKEFESAKKITLAGKEKPISLTLSELSKEI